MSDSAATVPSTPSGLRRTSEGHVAVLEIDRPPVNYFDEDLVRALSDAVLELDRDESCRVILLCARGKHFCAGADFGSGDFAVDRAATAARLYRAAIPLFQGRKPIVAAVQGSAIGGGLGLACAADFRVAEANSRFVANFARLGIHQGFGLSATLPAIVGRQRAADLLLRGASVSGEEALSIGLADRLAEPNGVRALAMTLAEEIASAAPLAVSSIRQTLRGDLGERVQDVLDRELSEQTRLWATADSAEGIAAARERRAASFTGR